MPNPLEKYKKKPRAPKYIRKQARELAEKGRGRPKPKHIQEPLVYIFERPGDYTEQIYEPELSEIKPRVSDKLMKHFNSLRDSIDRKLEVRPGYAGIRWTYPF
jgi:hypothetical protein